MTNYDKKAKFILNDIYGAINKTKVTVDFAWKAFPKEAFAILWELVELEILTRKEAAQIFYKTICRAKIIKMEIRNE